MLINGALTCWNMKNCLEMWRLHRRTHRMTDCTFPLLSGRKTLQQNICFTRNPRSASHWWCRSVCQNWAALVWKFWAWSQGEWSLLLQHSAVATYAAGHTSHRQRVLHISAGQCYGAPGLWDDLERETPTFILLDLYPLNSSDLNPIDYKV